MCQYLGLTVEFPFFFPNKAVESPIVNKYVVLVSRGEAYAKYYSSGGPAAARSMPQREHTLRYTPTQTWRESPVCLACFWIFSLCSGLVRSRMDH